MMLLAAKLISRFGMLVYILLIAGYVLLDYPLWLGKLGVIVWLCLMWSSMVFLGHFHVAAAPRRHVHPETLNGSRVDCLVEAYGLNSNCKARAIFDECGRLSIETKRPRRKV